ncbi:hypothetical protein [Hymenobacter arizonensis]|uniref:Helix-turn-helix domain-containing protein n=1 Tax=Hymenobacter arizonensis TaxID=1227077 RepID=A0A1I5YZ23_HYMAR|nr:hypothetical protein [Hymenobacter arizonensis]SFQ49481.1 hypothetical protein SAMN04515668_2557 [Hymenobacter arizonensis]
MPAANYTAAIIAALTGSETAPVGKHRRVEKMAVAASPHPSPKRRNAAPRDFFIPKEVMVLPIGWSARLVLSETINLERVSGEVWANDHHFVDRCRISKRAVGSALQELERAGLLLRITRQNAQPKRKLIPLLPSGRCNNAAETEKGLVQDLPEPTVNVATEQWQHLPKPIADSAKINTHLNGRVKINKTLSAETGNEIIKSALLPSVATEPDGAASFEEFWNKYGKKNDRYNCQRKWAKLSAFDRSAILAHVDGYVAATPEVQYRKYPLTYLTGRSWLDEDLPTQPLAPTLRGVCAPPSPDTTSYSLVTLLEQQANTHIK